ncbi:hypothetical protein ACIF9R_21295 [Streptomyces sp. NPDC086080]|uniref:hypothetical protein n=1 Tax=Streptomyces sp. NPDC086080 TaxID=3365748 RepID=UPI0037D4DCA0
MITRPDEDPEFEPDDPLAVILRPASDFLGPPPGRFEAIRRGAARRRLVRTVAGVGLACAAAVLVSGPLQNAATTDRPAPPTVPLAPPPVSTAPSPALTPSPTVPVEVSESPGDPRTGTTADPRGPRADPTADPRGPHAGTTVSPRSPEGSTRERTVPTPTAPADAR